MTGQPGQPTVSAASEVDLSTLGPAARLAVKVAVNACDSEILRAEQKLAIRSLNGLERDYWEKELYGWQLCRHQLLTQDYPPPYKPGQTYSESESVQESPTST